MKYSVGFIGAGNMGGALAKCVCEVLPKDSVAVCCSTEKHSAKTAEKLGCKFDTAEEIAQNSEFLFLGVKPQYAREIFGGLKPYFDKNKDCVFVSMLSGVSLSSLFEMLGERKIIRIMPNTPCAVGMGMTQYCKNSNVTDKDIEKFLNLMSKSGMVDELSENLIDAASAVSGCGPAFLYMFAQALADGGVKCGLPRKKALQYASQMISGSAEMILKSEKHPEQLKDEVCSPGGSTICGVSSLENGGFRASVISAVESAYKKTKNM